jgi:monoamine oxidase
MKSQPDVLIIGGGVAGLTAARRLTGAGLQVTLLEARDRLGGRICTAHTENGPVELGAEFVHGRPQEIFALAAESPVPIVPVEGEFRRKGEWFDAGRLMAKMDQLFEKMPASTPARAIPARSEGSTAEADQSFRQYLDSSEAADEVKQMALQFVEGFHAADPAKISVQALQRDSRAEEAIDGDRQFRMAEGYDRLVHAIEKHIDRKRCEMALNAPVTEVRWKPCEVAARTPKAEFHAARAVVTVPLGVLKSNSMVFSPTLQEKQNAMKFLEMGPVVRVTLRFAEKFWEREPEMAGLGFLFTDDPDFPTWWTSNPLASPILTGWAAGPRAAALQGLKQEALAQKAVQALARIMGRTSSEMERLALEAFVHDWQGDPFARGAYSYTTVGGLDAARTLAAPVEHTLYFAGEATNFQGYGGTVHGAIATGERVAREVLQSMGIRPGMTA